MTIYLLVEMTGCIIKATFINDYFHNGMMALTDLMKNGHYAKHHLINGLYSDDEQLSFCA